MGDEAIYPGTIDWSGENPVMYLKAAPDGPFVTPVSFFQVVVSPHGRGHAAVLRLPATTLIRLSGISRPLTAKPLASLSRSQRIRSRSSSIRSQFRLRYLNFFRNSS